MKTITKIYRHFHDDSLYRNSIYLMLSTFVMAFFGFFFWIINARLYTTEQIGLATTLISVTGLVANISLLGFNNTVIRYAAKTSKRDNIINTSVSVVLVASVIVACIYLLGIQIFTPKLAFIRHNITYSIILVLSICAIGLNLLSESIFTALRSTVHILIKNLILSFTKVVLPIALLSYAAYGIFIAVTISTISGLVYALIILYQKHQITIAPEYDKETIKLVGKYSLGNYIATVIGGLPPLLIPVLLTNLAGASTTAYFYIDYMLINILNIVPLATTSALFAEGSHSETNLRQLTFKSIRIIALIVIPAIILMALFGQYLLLAFGKKYSSEGIVLLRLLACASIFYCVNSVGSTLLYIRHKILTLTIINIISTSLSLGLTYIFLNLNLVGVGIAWIITQAVLCIIYLFLMNRLLQ